MSGTGTSPVLGLIGALVLAAVYAALLLPVGETLRLWLVADPVDGFWLTARRADHLPTAAEMPPPRDGPLDIVWDRRRVPHFFAASDADAVRAFGCVTAMDRLFQVDFLRRVTQGRLAEILGSGAVDSDRYLRQTGMREAVQYNVGRARSDGGEELEVAGWYADGFNACLERLDERELPFEMRLLGYRPEPFRAEDVFHVGWNLIFDLTYQREGAVGLERLRGALGETLFDRLYPESSPRSRPIVPQETPTRPLAAAGPDTERAAPLAAAGPDTERAAPLAGLDDGAQAMNAANAPVLLPAAQGYVPGKGSNNWAVSGSRSTTGAPILAGDMHLSLSLPAIWYEVHMVTPTMDTYGVTVPGMPFPIEAFNRDIGWTFTNTGADQIDHLLLRLDSTGTRYAYEDVWRDLEVWSDTIRVAGSDDVPLTLRRSHWGPVSALPDGRSIATLWTGHGDIRTFQALWRMNRAHNYRSFEDALRLWDAPMQNILYAGPGDTIAIRSTGHLPIREGRDGSGLRPGWSSRSAWIGRVPFEELPHVIKPPRGYLTSTNQRPSADGYPYYLGRHWTEIFRSIRIDSLLSGRPTHDVAAIASYQTDVLAVQRQWFVPLLDPLVDLPDRARALRDHLQAWDGTMAVDRFEPILFDRWMRSLEAMTWDEAAFDGGFPPTPARLYELLMETPEHPLLDRIDTTERDTALGLLRGALVAAARDLDDTYGRDWTVLRWGDQHRLVVRHITRSEALRPLWRGPMPFPGYSQTLSPGAGRTVTFSASWRVVLDFSGGRPVGRGVYPGGQSGNPFSAHYDDFLDDYLAFRWFDLQRPDTPQALADPLHAVHSEPRPQ